jgi:hypothetical protein
VIKKKEFCGDVDDDCVVEDVVLIFISTSLCLETDPTNIMYDDVTQNKPQVRNAIVFCPASFLTKIQ